MQATLDKTPLKDHGRLVIAKTLREFRRVVKLEARLHRAYISSEYARLEWTRWADALLVHFQALLDTHHEREMMAIALYRQVRIGVRIREREVF